MGEIPLGNFGYFLVRVVRRNFEKFAVFVGNFAVSHFVIGGLGYLNFVRWQKFCALFAFVTVLKWTVVRIGNFGENFWSPWSAQVD